MSEQYVLETRNLVKEFKGFVAVNDVNLQIRQGDIHALIGPNGAGKTTVFNLLTKFLIPTRGQILYRGEDITPLKSAAIARKGIVRSFQISAVFPHMTALENIRVALQTAEGSSYSFWKSGNSLHKLNERCMELLESEHDFRTLVVDTVDLLWNQLCDHICRKEGVAHISDFKSFSKGYRMAKDELQRVLTKVANLTTKKGHSMGLVLISHVSETEDDGHLVWAPSISKSPRQVLTSMADVVCFADIYKDSSGEIKRVLRLGPHPNYMTGGRIPNLPDVVSLEYQEFEDAVMNAIKGVSNV